MTAVWDESRWAVLGVLLRKDGFSPKEAAQFINCSDGAVKQAFHVRDKGVRELWAAVVAGEVTVSDAETLVRRFENDGAEQTVALQRVRNGEISELRQHRTGLMDSKSTFKGMAHKFANAPSPDWSFTPEQVEEGIRIAEEGLDEDAATWPSY